MWKLAKLGCDTGTLLNVEDMVTDGLNIVTVIYVLIVVCTSVCKSNFSS